MTKLVPTTDGADYGHLLAEIKERVKAAQIDALRAVNKELVALYWDVGQTIVRRQAKERWGDSVVERLAVDLRAEFPGVGGFSASNLWRMKAFFEAYAAEEVLAPLVREIAWSHNLVILAAMGAVFAFVGSQFRLEVDDHEYFIDLLLYHRRLRSLVAIELKVGEFQPEFVGKMQFYLAALDARVREPGENRSIGIILCKDKSRTIVEYALHDATKPIGVATYRIVRRLPRELKGLLPSPEQIAALLRDGA